MTGTLFDVVPDDVADGTDEWYTPPWIFEAARIRFAMDVAAPVLASRRTCPADEYLTVVEDGLTAPWAGTVWLNPPYSQAGPWVARWADHPSGLILLPAMRTVYWLGEVMKAADALTLLSVDFYRPDATLARIRWTLVLAGRGRECSEAVARVAAADRYAAGAFMVNPGLGPGTARNVATARP
jgi:hypothetical protein